MQDVVVILDNIRSLHNVGSIFRTSDAAGVNKLYLCGITPTPDHPRFDDAQAKDSLNIHPDKYGRKPEIAKTALAGLHAVPWEHCESTAETVKRLKTAGYRIAALELAPGSKPVSKSDSRPLALVLGHEREGVHPEVLKLADEIVHIPMHGQGVSLNVSVAYGIAIYALLGIT